MEDNIKVDLKETICKIIDWILLAQDWTNQGLLLT